MKPREYTADEIALMRHAFDGTLALGVAAMTVGVSEHTVRRYWRDAGWNAAEATPPPHEVPANSVWTPIAHTAWAEAGTWRVWREYDDAPIGIDAALAADAAGRGWVMHRRTAAGHDLVWKARGS